MPASGSAIIDGISEVHYTLDLSIRMRLDQVWILAATVCGAAACDSGSSARNLEVERTVQAQATQIQALEGRIEQLENKVAELNWLKVRFNSAIFDPSDQGFERLDSSVGTFAISIQEVSAHADGVRVRLHVGNLSTATVGGGKFKAKWGSRQPKMGEKGWISKYQAWEKSLLQKDISFTEDLRPGTWNNVTLILPGVPPEKFGHLELQMETTQIKLTVPRR